MAAIAWIAKGMSCGRIGTLLAMLLLFAQVIAADVQASPSAAADQFLGTLSSQETGSAVMAFTDADRKRSRYTPGSRGGLVLSRMDAETRKATFDLLAAVLSPRGVEMVEAIIHREAVLGEIEGNPDYRDPDKYYLALFGKPDDERWGMRFEGHHLSINLTLSGDRVLSVLPLSLGANPEELPKTGEKLLRPLFDLAEKAAANPSAETMRTPVDWMLAVFPKDTVGDLGARLAPLLASDAPLQSSDVLHFSGSGATLRLEGRNRNHIHATLGADAEDFGGN